VKFLIDECLSPELAVVARARGFPESSHVTWLGMRSRKDWTIVRRALNEGFVLVTNNSADFTELYEHEEIHLGLVCLNMAPRLMKLENQKSLFLLALDRLGDAEPINEVLDITLAADGIVHVKRYILPSD
jgi:predicted nuclease of predicted toxin-antitoxin system